MLDFPYRLGGTRLHIQAATGLGGTLLEAGRYTATGWEVHCYRLSGLGGIMLQVATGLGDTMSRVESTNAT